MINSLLSISSLTGSILNKKLKSPDLTSARVFLNRLVDVVGDCGPVVIPEGLATSVHQRAAQSADEALEDGLNVAAVAPQASREITERI